MYITEIFTSIQGESSWVGKPCTFIRLSGCPLRCRWCDTVYSYNQGQFYTMEQVLTDVDKRGVKLVEVTGGEPLAQAETPELVRQLLAKGYEVLIETSGSEPIEVLPAETNIIMDIKCPDSGMVERNRLSNIEFLKPNDEVKFVVASRADFDWACAFIADFRLKERCRLLLSPAWGLVKPKDLVEWILASALECRLNLQIHKYIWSPNAKGV